MQWQPIGDKTLREIAKEILEEVGFPDEDWGIWDPETINHHITGEQSAETSYTIYTKETGDDYENAWVTVYHTETHYFAQVWDTYEDWDENPDDWQVW